MANEPHDRVMIGQIWQDCDKRVQNRLLRVVACRQGYAFCEEGYKNQAGQYSAHRNSKSARIRIDRMKPTSTGFRLWQDAPR